MEPRLLLQGVGRHAVALTIPTLGMWKWNPLHATFHCFARNRMKWTRGCWSLLLAGPSLHVTVLVFDQKLAKAAIDMVKTRGNHEFVNIVFAEKNASVTRASDLLLPLTLHSPMNRMNVFGFEFLVLLDMLQTLSLAAVQDLTFALQPFMHTRSKALVSAYMCWGSSLLGAGPFLHFIILVLTEFRQRQQPIWLNGEEIMSLCIYCYGRRKRFSSQHK